MKSKNLLDPQWIVGFVDGEGNFNLDVHIHNSMKYGLQVQPEFSIVQHQRDLDLLKRIKDQFECGTIAVNRKDVNSVRYHWRVKNLPHAINIIIPFFERYKLQTKKGIEFKRWREICVKMNTSSRDLKDLLKMGEALALGYSLLFILVDLGKKLRYVDNNTNLNALVSKKREFVNKKIAFLKELQQQQV